MFLQNRIEFILDILYPFGFITAFILTGLGLALHVLSKARPFLPLYYITYFFFALFGVFLVGYIFHQIPDNPDPFLTSLFTFGLIASPFAFLLLIGGMSGKGLRLDLFSGLFSLILFPLAAALVTYAFVAIQSLLWCGILWN